MSRHYSPRFININIKQAARIREFQISIWSFIFILFITRNWTAFEYESECRIPAIRSADPVLKFFSILNNHPSPSPFEQPIEPPCLIPKRGTINSPSLFIETSDRSIGGSIENSSHPVYKVDPSWSSTTLELPPTWNSTFPSKQRFHTTFVACLSPLFDSRIPTPFNKLTRPLEHFSSVAYK